MKWKACNTKMTEREPRYPRIIFGDAAWGVAVKTMRKKDLDGTEMIEFKIRPSRAMQEYYGISDEKLDHMGCVTRMFPKSQTKQMNDDPLLAAWFVKCTFEWDHTRFTIEDQNYEIIEAMQIKLKRLTQINFALMEELNKIGSRNMEYWKSIRETEKLIRGREESVEDMQQQMYQDQQQQ